MVPELTVDGLVVPVQAALDLSQTYEEIGGVSLRRTLGGGTFRQSHWTRLKTALSGGGWCPFAHYPLGSVHLLGCIAPRSLMETGPVLTLPAARRSDVPLQGWALVGGELVATPVVLSGHVATLTPVPGATQYQVSWYPLLQVVFSDLKYSAELRQAQYQWQLTAEEV